MKTFGDNTIELLNTGIDRFYSYEADLIDAKKIIEFKAMFITFMNQLERVFNGVFGKAFRIDDEDDVELFKELFPVVYEAATSKRGNEGLKEICSILTTFRNINAHAYCECDYAKELDVKYILEQLPNYNPSVIYWTKDNIPTLAGMITLLFFLSNDTCAKIFIRNDIWNGFIENLNFFGKDYEPNLYDFPTKVMEVNRINDEIAIRKGNFSDTIIDSIFGRFSKEIIEENEEYKYQNGNEFEDSSFHVSFKLQKKTNSYVLCIQRNSNYHCYFSNDYILEIKDVESFVKWCNSVPPFMFVVYLYKAKITVYTKESINEKMKESVLKLNKPKFYVDKNVDTLFLSDSLSDIRMGGQVVSIGINYCLYMFEFMIFKRKNLRIIGYSTLKQSLEKINLPTSILNKIVSIRNFFSHYYLLGDTHVVGKGCEKIDIEFVIMAFDEFIKWLEGYDSYKAMSVSNDFYYRVICSMFLFKYADIMKKSDRFLNNPDSRSFEAVYKTNKRIENSFITNSVEELIKRIYPDRGFQIYKEHLKTINKCVIKSSVGIRFKNGEEFNGPITLYTSYTVKPYHYIDNETCELVSEVNKGFKIEKIWEVE